MIINRKKLNLGKVYFWYLFFVLFLQMLGISGQNDTLELMWKAGVISLTMFYVLLKRSWKIVQYIVIPCVIYVIGQLLAFVFNPDYSLSSILNCVIVLAMTYLFMSVSSNNRSFEMEDMFWYVNAFIVLMLYAVAFNFVKNPSAVLKVLSNRNVYVNMMSSFFDNKQTFGMFLFAATIVSSYGYVLSTKKIYVLLSMFFFGNLFICSSRTALFACIAFILMLVVLFFNTNRRLAISILQLVLIFGLAIAVIPQLRRFVFQVLLDTESTFNVRERIWQSALISLRAEKIIVGYGEGNAYDAIASVASKGANSHNGIIQVLLTGGILKLILYICVLLKSLFCIVRIRKHNSPLANVFFSALVSVLVFSMGEALVLLDTSSPCIVASTICVAFPVAVDGYYRRGGK